MTPKEIESAFRLYGQVIPASTADCNRRRTAYFYRREAIAWAREARLPNWRAIAPRETSIDIAKSLLATYRQLKST